MGTSRTQQHGRRAQRIALLLLLTTLSGCYPYDPPVPITNTPIAGGHILYLKAGFDGSTEEILVEPVADLPPGTPVVVHLRGPTVWTCHVTLTTPNGHLGIGLAGYLSFRGRAGTYTASVDIAGQTNVISQTFSAAGANVPITPKGCVLVSGAPTPPATPSLPSTITVESPTPAPTP